MAAGQDEDSKQTTTTDTQPPEAATKPTETPPTPQAPVVVEEPKGGEGKTVQLQTSDFKKIKDEARDKGRREALTELDTQAKEAGFESHADALKALASLKKPPAPEAKTEQTPPQEQKTMSTKNKQDKDKDADRQAREQQRLSDERAKLRKDWKQSQRKQRDLQRQLDAKEAEKDLLLEMTRFGVKDLDYGMRLLTRELAGKSEEEISKFDRKAFFEKIRTEKPYLFGEVVVPATTGTNGTEKDGGSPATPDAKKPVVDAAAAKQFDARTATREQYEEHLKKLGLNSQL